MDLALNDLQWLMCYKTKPNEQRKKGGMADHPEKKNCS